MSDFVKIIHGSDRLNIIVILTEWTLVLNIQKIYWVSTAPGNTGNLLEFDILPGNTVNLLKFNWSCWKIFMTRQHKNCRVIRITVISGVRDPAR